MVVGRADACGATPEICAGRLGSRAADSVQRLRTCGDSTNNSTAAPAVSGGAALAVDASGGSSTTAPFGSSSPFAVNLCKGPESFASLIEITSICSPCVKRSPANDNTGGDAAWPRSIVTACTNPPSSPAGSSPMRRMCEAIYIAAIHSSRVPLPRPASASLARNSMWLRTDVSETGLEPEPRPPG
jgi:hypothetical protein